MDSASQPLARRVDLTSLRVFVAVAEEGSIARGAEREFIAASAASKRVAELELLLDTPLLHRRARGVDLTAAGQSLLLHARSVLYGVEKMERELAEYATGVRGHVRVHASMSAIVQFLPDDLGGFARRHPQVKLDLEEHLSSEVARAVAEGAADLGIGSIGAEATSLQVRPYREDQLALVVPGDHALAGRSALHFAETLGCDHVGLHVGSSISLALQQAAARARGALRLRIRVTGLDAMARMIAGGLGVGVMPLRAFELVRGSSTLRAIRLLDGWATRRINLVARDFTSLPPTARALVEHLALPGHTLKSES